MQTPPITLHYEDRAAPQLLAGVLYQLVWTANRWASLTDDEVLVVEGDEDLVVGTIKDGQVVALEHGQIKLLSGKITARSSAAYETLFAFLCSFHALSLEGKRCTFVFTTNAALGRQRIDPVPAADAACDLPGLTIDLLTTWHASATLTPEQVTKLTAGMKALVALYVERAYPQRAPDAKGPKPSIDAARVRRAVEFLDEAPGRWEKFLRAVELQVDAGDPQAVFGALDASLAQDSRAVGVEATALAYRLVFEVMHTGAESELGARHLRRAALDALIDGERSKVLDWMRSAHPERLWQLDAVNDLRNRVEQLEGGSASGVAGSELRARHLAEVCAQSSVFRVLGIDREIPTEHAWPLSARWTAQADGRDTTFHAHRLLESQHRMTLLVAEGGGGKSTVLRRIAYNAAARDSVVVHVRAKTLAALADGVPTFAVALRRLIADQSGVTFSEAAQLEAELDLLLLDGLDEVGERAEALASECAAYAATRNRLRLVMTTRPSHAAAAGESFVRATLLPLREHERWSAVVQLLRAAGESADSAQQIASRLDRILEKTSFESLPLHITMALQLARSDDHGRVSLATLYDRVLTSLRSRPVPDRTVPQVDRAFAARVLDAAAWYFASQDGSLASEVVRSVADEVAGGHGIEEETRVDEALLFWEARAVLRRERVEGNDRLDFAHESIRDFVAAQHLTRLPSAERRMWIAEGRHGAVVRFAVAVAGEAVLEDVFISDPPKDADALIRCALVTKELDPPPLRFAEELAREAAPLLMSSIPRIVERVVGAILPLVASAPVAFAAAADAAIGAGEQWNVLAAWLVRVHTGLELVEPDALLALLASGAHDKRLGGDSLSWKLWNDLQEPALDALVRCKGREALEELVEAIVLGDGVLSSGAHARIVTRLSDWGYADLQTRCLERASNDIKRLDGFFRPAPAADRAFLELVVATFGPADARAVDSELPGLSALLHAFDFWHAAITDWDEVFFTKGAASMSVLLRGAAHAAACEGAALAAEAQYALAVSRPDGDERPSVDVRKLGSGSPRELNWEATSSTDLPIPDLYTALRWPGAYAHVALELLVHHADKALVRRVIQMALVKGVPSVVLIAEHLSYVLGSDLADVLAGAVATPTDATAPLLVPLAKLEPTSPRTLERVTSALESTNGVLVEAAAEAALKLPTTDGLSSSLRSQLRRWRSWAAGEGPLEKRENGLVEPGTTLYARRVAEKLVDALAAHHALTYEDLVSLAREGAGARKAMDALVAAAARDPALLNRALDDLASGALAARVAEGLLRSEGVPLLAAASRLLSFHEHADASVRRAVVLGLRACKWVPREEARRIWTAHLADPDVHVRNEAQRALDQGPLPWFLRT